MKLSPAREALERRSAAEVWPGRSGSKTGDVSQGRREKTGRVREGGVALVSVSVEDSDEEDKREKTLKAKSELERNQL